MRWIVAVTSSPALIACAGPQSSLAPAGPAAQTILTLSLVLFIGAAVIWLAVMALLACSLHRRQRMTEAPARRLMIFGGLALPTIVLLALLVYGVIAGARITALDQVVDQVVTVRAYQWGWEFGYQDADGHTRRTSIDRLHLPAGRLVEFEITSSDVIHSFWIPRLGGKIDALPGRINRLRLKADRDTPMTGQCAEFCGRDHALMRFEVEVMTADAFDDWLVAEGAGDDGRDMP